MTKQTNVQILNNPIYKRLDRINNVLEDAKADIEALPRTPLLSSVMKEAIVRGIGEATVTIRVAMKQMRGEL